MIDISFETNAKRQKNKTKKRGEAIPKNEHTHRNHDNPEPYARTQTDTPHQDELQETLGNGESN